MLWTLHNVSDKKLKYRRLHKATGLKTTKDTISVKYKLLYAIKITLRGWEILQKWESKFDRL